MIFWEFSVNEFWGYGRNFPKVPQNRHAHYYFKLNISKTARVSQMVSKEHESLLLEDCTNHTRCCMVLGVWERQTPKVRLWDFTMKRGATPTFRSTSHSAVRCCNCAASLQIFTNSSTRVAFGTFFRSLVKILKKGVAPPPEN